MNVPIVLELIIEEGFFKFAHIDGTHSPVQAIDAQFIWAQANDWAVLDMGVMYRFWFRVGVSSPENPER